MSKDKVCETKLQKILRGVNGERLTVNSKIKSGPGWSFTGNIPSQDQSPSIHGSRFTDFLRSLFTVYRSRLSIYDRRVLSCV